MRRVIGFALIFLVIGMLIALIIPNMFVNILIIVGAIVLGYNLFCY